MDISLEWLSEIKKEVTDFNMDYDQMINLSDSIDNFSFDPVSSECYIENMTFIDKSFQSQQLEIKPSNQQEKCSRIKKHYPPQEPLISSSHPLSKTFTISFGDINPKDQILQFNDSLIYKADGVTKIPATARNLIQAQDHVLQERKRKEKLNQQFISLSTIIPNIKKTGKASLLEDASNYIKELQGRVNKLEQLSGNKRNVQESVISIKRSRPSTSNDEYYSSDGTNCKLSPEIEVRMSESSVLVRIHCQKNFSYLVKALNQMQKLGLSIISSSAMPFAKTTLLINIVAEIEVDFCMTAAELVKNLQLAV